MKKLSILISIITLFILSYSQMPDAITIEPPDATAYDELTLYFDPNEACFESGSLSGLPNIAIHSGVTINGIQWQNTINFDEIGVNGQPTTLMPTGDGRFSITYTPAEYYGLTEEYVPEICAVFNNGTDWSQDGRDFVWGGSECKDFIVPLNTPESGWKWLNPSPQGHKLYDMCVIDDNSVCAVGQWGTILKSHNKGETWDIIDSGTKEDLYNVFFLNDEKGWCLGNPSSASAKTIYETDDGGNTWSQINYSIDPDFCEIAKFCFTSDNNGWGIGSGRIFQTSDGGNTWYTTEPYLEDLCDICFVNATNGWVVGYRNIYHTEDSGITWEILDLGANYYKCVCFINENIGWITNRSRGIYRTTDGGDNWESFYCEDVFLDMIFTDENNGWGVTDDESLLYGGFYIYNTSDGGENWEQYTNFTSPEMNGICFIDNDYGWVVGDYGGIVATSDSGNTWVELSEGPWYGFRDVVFLNSNNGWMVGAKYIYATNDGGNSWTQQYKGNDYSLRGTFFTDLNHGYAVGGFDFSSNDRFAALLTTVDGGDTWNEFLNSITDQWNDIFFINQNVGWMVGNEGIIFKTTNGTDWSLVGNTGTINALKSVCFLDLNIGWIAGANGTILYSDNGGESWQSQSSGTNSHLNDILFINESIGWIVGNDGIILQTENGGATWISQASNVTENLHKVYFCNDETGWAIGNQGTILHTANGSSWSIQESGTFNVLWGIDFLDEYTGWIVGTGGTVLHTNNGGMGSSDDLNLASLTHNISNYPNPFTTSTTLTYTLSKPSSVIISIFNPQGQLIEKIEQEQPKGEQQVQWNAAGLPAGMYYFRIQAGKMTGSGKIIKLQ